MKATYKQAISGAILIVGGIVVVIMGYGTYAYCGGVLMSIILTQWNAGDEA